MAKVEIVGFTKRPKEDIREAAARAVKGRLNGRFRHWTRLI